MARGKILVIFIATAVMPILGCGTLCDLTTGSPHPPGSLPLYRGVVLDAVTVILCGKGIVSSMAGKDEESMPLPTALAGLLLFTADMPISAAADTVLFPILLVESIRSSAAPASEDDGSKVSEAATVE
jgi:uncharacterized protein YceK